MEHKGIRVEKHHRPRTHGRLFATASRHVQTTPDFELENGRSSCRRNVSAICRPQGQLEVWPGTLPQCQPTTTSHHGLDWSTALKASLKEASHRADGRAMNEVRALYLKTDGFSRNFTAQAYFIAEKHYCPFCWISADQQICM